MCAHYVGCGPTPKAQVADVEAVAKTHPPLLCQRLIRRRLEKHDTPRDVDDGRTGYSSEGFSKRQRLGRKDVAVLVLFAWLSGPTRVSTGTYIA